MWHTLQVATPRSSAEQAEPINDIVTIFNNLMKLNSAQAGCSGRNMQRTAAEGRTANGDGHEDGTHQKRTWHYGGRCSETRRVVRRMACEEAAQAHASIKEVINFEEVPQTDIKALQMVAEMDVKAPRMVADIKAPQMVANIKAPQTVAETDAKASRTVADIKAPRTVDDIKAPQTVADVKAPQTVADIKALRTVAETDNKAPRTVAKTETHCTEVTTLEVATGAAAAEQQTTAEDQWPQSGRPTTQSWEAEDV